MRCNFIISFYFILILYYISFIHICCRRIVISVSDDSAHLCCYDTGKHIDSIPCRFPGIYGKLASRNQSKSVIQLI